MAEYDKPVEEDLRQDDIEYNPAVEPKSAKAWLNLLQESEDAFERYNEHCDKIDKQYASLERLSNMARDKQFQIFWANAEIIKPSIYAKPPVPVVVPKFKDRRPVYQAASEFLERCTTVAFDLAGIDELMKLVRDDLALIDRGVAWCRYESGKGNSYYDHEKVCIDFKPRRDFLHSISRNWREVTWVAAASYLTRGEARKRFRKTSGDEYQNAEYRVDKDTQEIGGTDRRERAKFWEIWDKGSRRVCWVAKGCDKILDEDDPHLDLREYFPCPKPAYGSVQRGSLVPVPDVLQYKDQLDEINLLTGRIHALSDALEAKGFYPAGGAELADAIEAAIKTKTAGRVLVPISNWAAFGGSNEVIIWLPIDMIANTITTLVTLRTQIINDIYQLTGMSDIMRGSTDPQETLGAQQLKTDYGSIRVRDKQEELARFARDLVEIASEIITEKFDAVTMIEMTQTQLPTQAMQKQQADALRLQLQNQQLAMQKIQQLPQVQQVAQQNPQAVQQVQQQGQQLIQSGQAALKKIVEQPTVEQVLAFLKNNRVKSFVLDIETDSTIAPDESAEKQRRGEFIGMLSQLLPQLSQMIMMQPKTAQFCGELLKFAVAPFRAGRALDGAIDELAAVIEDSANQPKGDDPATAQSKAMMQVEQMKLTYAKQKDDADRQVKVAELQQRAQTDAQKVQVDAQSTATEVQGRQQEHAMKVQQIGMQAEAQQQDHAAQMAQMAQKSQLDAQKHEQTMRLGEQKQMHFDQMAQDRRAQQQFKAMQPNPRVP
jgi:hypothetical protein